MSNGGIGNDTPFTFWYMAYIFQIFAEFYWALMIFMFVRDSMIRRKSFFIHQVSPQGVFTFGRIIKELSTFCKKIKEKKKGKKKGWSWPRWKFCHMLNRGNVTLLTVLERRGCISLLPLVNGKHIINNTFKTRTSQQRATICLLSSRRQQTIAKKKKFFFNMTHRLGSVLKFRIQGVRRTDEVWREIHCRTTRQQPDIKLEMTKQVCFKCVVNSLSLRASSNFHQKNALGCLFSLISFPLSPFLFNPLCSSFSRGSCFRRLRLSKIVSSKNWAALKY